MNRTMVLVAGLAMALVSALRAQDKNLTLEQASGRGEPVSFAGKLKQISWAADQKHVLLGSGKEARWLDPGSLEESAAPEGKSEDDGSAALKSALEQLPGFDAKTAESAAHTRGDRSADATLVTYRGDLFFHRAGKPAVRLTNTPEDEELAQLSPDGRFASYVRGNNLFLRDTEGSPERPLSKDGSEALRYGKLDWVYQEEVYGRGNYQGAFWSPDSKRLAYLRLDGTLVPRHTIVDHLPQHQGIEELQYPKAGDQNPQARLGVVRAIGGATTWLDLSRYDPDLLIVRVQWTPDSKHLLVQIQDREQTWLDLDEGDPDSGSVRVLIHEQSKSWVNVLDGLRWLEDGTFLWQSERSGHQHVYHYAADGTLENPVTQGDWDVKSILRLDEKLERLWFTSNKDGAVDANAYVIDLDGENLARLTSDRGSHSVTFNEDASYFLDRFSSVTTPPEMRLCKSDGSIVKVLAQAEIPALKEYKTGKRELLEIPARDGFLMDATILKPTDFNPQKSHPVWIMTYSGPDAPSVRNAWNGSAWDQFLAERGFIVFQVNNRTSSGKGLVAIETCYQQLGVQELRDLEDAVAWLCKNPWADAARVGITGWSYGGFMTAFALTHSKAFRLGIAGAGVYDWRNYDTIYTERYMRTPQHNPKGYADTSCVEAAAQLSGHLLLLHGSIDDNVHLQNTMQFIYALERSGKTFDLMIYPKSRHGIGDPELRWHMRQLEWRTIRTQLGNGDTAE
ncbi:MAG: S9 family peptidase [Planctomycetota bacterium]